MFNDSTQIETIRLQNCPNKNGKTVPCRRNAVQENTAGVTIDRKSTRLNSSHAT